MKIFNAKLDVLSISPQAVDRWGMTANVVDNSGQFLGSDVQVNDIVYCYALTEMFETVVSRYKVTTINSVSGITVDIVLTWNEPNTTYAEPQSGVDCIIGRPLPGGVTSITSTNNGVGSEILQLARNIDLQTASFSGGNDMTPTTISSVAGIVTLPATGSDLFIVNGSEDVTMITGRTSGEVTIIWNFARNVVYTANQLEPNSQMTRYVGQSEINTFVFVGSVVKEKCAPGGNFTLDGGGF